MFIPLALIGTLAACGGGDEPAADETPAATQAPAATPAPEATQAPAPAGAAAVPAALDFSAPLVGGGDIEVAALAGRPVLLWFWAPW